jgi:hypothetical protein
MHDNERTRTKNIPRIQTFNLLIRSNDITRASLNARYYSFFSYSFPCFIPSVTAEAQHNYRPDRAKAIPNFLAATELSVYLYDRDNSIGVVSWRLR